MIILTIAKDGFVYRFTDVVKVGDHYIAHIIRDDNTIGKMEHRITQKEYEDGTHTDSDKTN